MTNNMEAIDFIVNALENYKEDGKEAEFTFVTENMILLKLNGRKYSLILNNIDKMQRILKEADRLEY